MARRDSESYQPTKPASDKSGAQTFCGSREVSGQLYDTTWLAEPPVADLVTDALHHRDGRVYRLDAFSIMPNHVHSVFMPLMWDENPHSLSSIMHSVERHTAQQANQVLGRSGIFWRVRVSITTFAPAPNAEG
ncbi:MAG: hypothetical protein ACT4OT_12920 [Acidobacteriota bacterium]